MLYCMYVFFSLPPPPRRSTPFPYTTLFRSRRALGRRRAPLRVARLDRAPRGRDLRRRERVPAGRRRHRARDHRRPPRDRKSTRLNSSHLGISYAVFCLKKKKTSKTTNITFL